MNTSVSVYKIPEERKKSSYEKVKREYRESNRHYQGHRPISFRIIDDYYEDLELFSLDVLNLKISQNDIKNEVNLNSLKDAIVIIGEQMSYLESIKTICDIFFIEAKLNEHLYGSIFVFYHKDWPDRIMIQGITKYITSLLFVILFPEFNKELPKLNSLLDPVIESLARRLGAKYIYVRPIGKQGAILEKHYGYIKTQEKYNPIECNISLGFETFYVKYLD